MGHHHHHHHHHDMSSKRLGWVFVVNFTFTIIEFIGGVLTNSTAIMADAIHDLGDSLAIGLGWLLQKLSNKQPTSELSYGYRRLSLFAAAINGLILVIGSVWILFEAVPRLIEPQMPHAQGMFWLALLGIVSNGFAAWKLHGSDNLNERVLNWHLIEDVLGWVAVLIVSIILMFYPVPILDPILSIAFTLFILFNVSKIIGQTAHLFLQGTPDVAVRQQVKMDIEALANVESVHRLHIWSLDGERHVLTAHVDLNQDLDKAELIDLKSQIRAVLQPFHFEHTTIEVEFASEPCRDEAGH